MHITLIPVYSLLLALASPSPSFSKEHLSSLRNRTRSLFQFGWDSYLQHGFPADEVTPISCKPYGPSPDSRDLRNDVLGNYSLTLVDSLDTFIVMGDYEQFANGIKLLIDNVQFDLDSTVQVFETSIRGLGALLSLHLYASDSRRGFQIANYSNELLIMAHDLGLRLLPAYSTESGIPYPRINLRHGTRKIPDALLYETCAAGAASPMVEMTLLSRLTGDSRFEVASRNAFMTLWESRSKLNLVPMTLTPVKSKWLDQITGIGASIDSFYEYALKGAILFNDYELFNVWETSYNALAVNAKSDWFYANVDTDTGMLATNWIDSLSAFFPGLQVLAGKIDDAIRSHLMFYKLWNTFGAIPERWNFQPQLTRSTANSIALEWYPLRPEFVESTYHLYRATKDPLYLQVGAGILTDLETRFKTNCGFAGIQDIRTNKPQDRMESFFLSETLKYLYLLFDENNPIHFDTSSNTVFSTEGHLLWLDPENEIPYGIDHEVFENGSKLNGNGLVDAFLSFSRNFVDFNYGKLKKYYSPRKRSSDYNSLFIESKLNKSYVSGLDDLGLTLVDQDLTLDNEICEVSLPSVFRSNVFAWDKFYEIDERYSTTLIPPSYLNRPFFEHQESFVDIWGSGNLQCLRRPTTHFFEILFGSRDQIRLAQVDKFEQNKHIVKKRKSFKKSTKIVPKDGDFWVPLLDGIRMKLERIKPKKIDSTNRLITDAFVSEIRSANLKDDPLNDYDLDGSCSVQECPSLLRIVSVNGRSVEPGRSVWIKESNMKLLAKGQIVPSKGKTNMVLLNNEPVVNMFFLKG